MMVYWNQVFKMQFLKYLNSGTNPSFTLPPSSYSWINKNVTDSVLTFKLTLYDKFAIMNIQPNYQQKSLIYLIENYIQANMPMGPNGKPYSFTSFIEELYDFFLQ